MAYVITDKCRVHSIECRSEGACQRECPQSAIFPACDAPQYLPAFQLYIDAEVCIDCGFCASACPYGAIFPDSRVPRKKLRFIDINNAYFQSQ